MAAAVASPGALLLVLLFSLFAAGRTWTSPVDRGLGRCGFEAQELAFPSVSSRLLGWTDVSASRSRSPPSLLPPPDTWGGPLRLLRLARRSPAWTPRTQWAQAPT
eukprot:scaffold3068_cov401-Prasinococcus_capsulatus_cf.AAC.52